MSAGAVQNGAGPGPGLGSGTGSGIAPEAGACAGAGAAVCAATGIDRGTSPLPGLEPGTLPDGVRLVLVRHGETDWNMARRIQGQLDEPLNDTGRQQARAAAARFAPGMVDAILCSDLGRAAQTAAPLGEATGVTVQPQAVWRERHFGRFQGWRYAEIAEQAPAVFARIEARDPDLDLDGGESLLQVRARIDAALQALVARYRGQRVVVVSHGGVLDAVYRLVAGKPVSEPRDFPIHNACICRLHWVDGQWHIDRWADIDHLLDSQDEIDPRSRPAALLGRVG